MMQDEVCKYCVSWMTIQVSSVGLERFVRAWNAHRIDGLRGGIPNELASRCNTIPLPRANIPSTDHAVQMYEDAGGQLRRDFKFGEDPLFADPALQQNRSRDFHGIFSSFEAIYENVISNDGEQFKQALLLYLQLTVHYTP